MSKKPFLLFVLLLCFSMSCLADITIVKTVQVSIGNGHFMTLGKTITFPANKVNYANGFVLDNGDWINSTVDFTLGCWLENNWLNYTVTSLGSQQFHNGTRPPRVFIDGVPHLEGDGWTYASGTVSLTHASLSVWLSWSDAFPYSDLSSSTSSVSQDATQFSSRWNDDFGLSKIVFGCNITGLWFNETATAISGLQTTYTTGSYFNPNRGKVQYQFWANDTGNQWNTTGTQTYSVTQPAAPWTPPYVSLVHPGFTEPTWYFCDNLHTLDANLTAYRINETETSTSTQIEETYLGDVSVQFGWRVYKFLYGNYTMEISSGSPVAIVSRDKSASTVTVALSNYWRVEETKINPSMTALVMQLYMRKLGSAWALKATFCTDWLKYNQFERGNWTITLKVQRTENVTHTYARALWGSVVVNSNIANVKLKNMYPYEEPLSMLGLGNIIGAVLFIYTNTSVAPIGMLFYAIILFTFLGTNAIQYNSLKIVLVLMLLFGGTGGMFTFFMGAYGFAVAWAVILVLAGVFYAVFR